MEIIKISIEFSQFSYVSINQAQKVEYDEALEFLKSLEKEYETNSELQALIQDNIEQIGN